MEQRMVTIDSFPVEICQIQREKRSKLWRDVSLKGYNASKKKYFYGFKVHMVVTTNQEPVSCYISEGSMHDTTASYKFLPMLPENSIVIGDKGYISGKLKLFILAYSIDKFFMLSTRQQNLAFN